MHPLLMLAFFLMFAMTSAMAADTAAVAAKPAMTELRKLADKGDAKAQQLLGERYYKGEGVRRNLSEAARWYRSAADNGNADAQYMLGMMHVRGEGLPRDDAQAIRWFTAAAEQRLPSAQYTLGLAYLEGHGVAQDKIQAYKWFDIAAAMDHKHAVEARTALAPHLSKQELAKATQMAADWWAEHHH